MKKVKRIGILTSGGDCPGLNAVIRAVVKKATQEHGLEVIGIEDGFEGLIHHKHRKLTSEHVSGILTLGGTILGTSNRANPYRYSVKKGRDFILKDVSREAIDGLRRLKMDALVCVGGDGTLTIAQHLFAQGVPVVGIPKTIDNDVRGTEITFGFDTAVHIAAEGVDRLHTTAESHHRVMILEVMGRRAGWIALYAGLAGGGDIILIPEIPYEMDSIAAGIKKRRQKGKRFTILVISEGAHPKGGKAVIRETVKDATEPMRLGGISFSLGKEIEKRTGVETRNVVLGHLQRGGSPSPFDRILGTQLGAKAVDLIMEGHFGCMTAVQGNTIGKSLLSEAARGQRLVPIHHPLIETARSMGTSFGQPQAEIC